MNTLYTSRGISPDSVPEELSRAFDRLLNSCVGYVARQWNKQDSVLRDMENDINQSLAMFGNDIPRIRIRANRTLLEAGREVGFSIGDRE